MKAVSTKNDFQDLVREIRKDFPILNRPLSFGGPPRPLIYLDNAATTQKPQSVLDALTGYYENANSNVHRAIHSLGEESTRVFESARARVKDFIGASSVSEIVFTRGTTESINLVARSFTETLAAGDEIILTEMEHHSNLVPWQMAAERRNLVLKYLPFDPAGELEIDKLAGLWTDRTRLLAVTHMSNVLGTINPVKQLSAFAHARGVPILVDGAQSVPHMSVDVQDLDVDFLAFSSHKMCGPTGFGVLYGKERWLEALPPFLGGGEMIRSVTLEGFTTNVLPYKFEAGTPHMEGAAGLHAAIDYLDGLGLDWIHEYESILTRHTLDALSRIEGVTVFGQARNRGGIVAFTLDGVHSHDLSAFLDGFGVAVRAGHHCAHPLAKKLGVVSTARASFYFYNTLDEIDFFCESLEKAKKVL